MAVRPTKLRRESDRSVNKGRGGVIIIWPPRLFFSSTLGGGGGLLITSSGYQSSHHLHLPPYQRSLDRRRTNWVSQWSKLRLKHRERFCGRVCFPHSACGPISAMGSRRSDGDGADYCPPRTRERSRSLVREERLMRTTTSEPAAGSRHSSGPPPPPAPAWTTWPHPGEQFEHKRAGRPRCQRCGRKPGRQCFICGIRVGPGCCLASERPPRCVSHCEPDPEPEPEELKRTPSSSSSSSSASSSPSCAQEAQLDCDFRVPRWFTCTQVAQSNCDLRVLV